MTSTTRKFTVTRDHLKLLRCAYVSWCNDETGAPQIDPKRPYGNGSVVEDIHEILTGESVGTFGSVREELTDEEQRRYMALHRETETVVQIALATGTLEPGKYEADQYGRNWRKVWKL